MGSDQSVTNEHICLASRLGDHAHGVAEEVFHFCRAVLYCGNDGARMQPLAPHLLKNIDLQYCLETVWNSRIVNTIGG